MASYISILAILVVCVAYIQCQSMQQAARVGERVVIDFGSGDVTKTVGSKKTIFHVSGPNKGSFTDASGKKVAASNVQLQGNKVVITKATKADAGTYDRGTIQMILTVN